MSPLFKIFSSRLLSFFIRPKATLYINDKFLGQHSFTLSDKDMIIGRCQSAFTDRLIFYRASKINIASNHHTAHISHSHARLHWDPSTSHYRFISSSPKGSIVDGEPLGRGEEYAIQDGSEILIHPFRFTLRYL